MNKCEKKVVYAANAVWCLVFLLLTNDHSDISS